MFLLIPALISFDGPAVLQRVRESDMALCCGRLKATDDSHRDLFQSQLFHWENEDMSDLGSIGVAWWAVGYERETTVLLGCCSVVTDGRLGWNSFDLDLFERRVIAARSSGHVPIARPCLPRLP